MIYTNIILIFPT